MPEQQQWSNETPDQVEQVQVTQTPSYERHEQVIENTAAARSEGIFKLTQLIYLAFGILEGLIVLRIILKLIAANPASPFASLVYSFTDLFLWPFYGLTATPSFSGMVLEIPSIIALIVYALLAWAIVRLVWLLLDRRPTRSVSTYERDRRL